MRGRRRLLEAPQAEQFEMLLTAARLRQIGHDLPHDATEFETMPGEPSGDTNLWQGWMPVEDKMFVWSIGEETGFQRHRWSRGIREITCREAAQYVLILTVWLTIHLIGVDMLLQMMVASHLEAGDAIDRETIIMAFLHRQVEDREGMHTKQGRSHRLKPTQHLSLGYGQGRQFVDELRSPSAGTDDQFRSAVALAVGAHLHALALRFPPHNTLLAMHFRS